MRPWFVLLLLAGWAGCTDSSPSPGQAEDEAAANLRLVDEAAADVDVKATTSTGVIRGVVVDEAIRPLAGVVVAVQGTTLEAVTGEAGTFGFQGLSSGAHFLAATRERYQAVQVGVVVVAGKPEPELTRIVMAYIPGQEPFIEAFKARLFVAFGAPLVGAVGGAVLGVDEADTRVAYETTPTATVIQVEAVWDPVTPLATNAYLFGSATEEGRPLGIQTVVGPAPLAVRTNGTTDKDLADGFYFGVQAVPRPFTSTDPPDPNGLLLVNQAFETFAHVFHNFRPDEGWLFVRDGAHPLPP